MIRPRLWKSLRTPRLGSAGLLALLVLSASSCTTMAQLAGVQSHKHSRSPEFSCERDPRLVAAPRVSEAARDTGRAVAGAAAAATSAPSTKGMRENPGQTNPQLADYLESPRRGIVQAAADLGSRDAGVAVASHHEYTRDQSIKPAIVAEKGRRGQTNTRVQQLGYKSDEAAHKPEKAKIQEAGFTEEATEEGEKNAWRPTGSEAKAKATNEKPWWSEGEPTGEKKTAVNVVAEEVDNPFLRETSSNDQPASSASTKKAPVTQPEVVAVAASAEEPWGETAETQVAEQPCPDADSAWPGQPCPAPASAATTGVACAGACNSEAYPEELICNGGQTDTVRRDMPGDAGGGYEPESAKARFLDSNGFRRTKPTNSTCIYSPRFAAVRTATVPHLETSIDGLAGTQDTVRTGQMRNRLALDEKRQQTAVGGLRIDSRSSGIIKTVSEAVFDHDAGPRLHQGRVALMQGYAFFSDGVIRLRERAVIGELTLAAKEWSHDLGAMIVGTNAAGEQLQARVKADGLTGVEETAGPGELRIVKCADQGTANSGDEITFTIRFDNLGGQELCDVEILDNLSPRLEFLPESFEKTIAGTLNQEVYGGNATRLFFTLDAPLAGKSGGTITFKCRVR